MFDARLLPLQRALMAPPARVLVAAGVRADHITVLGCVIGVLAAVAAGFELYGWALAGLAANRLAEVGGGVTLFRDGEEQALVELPIAGLMSDSPAEDVAAKADALGDAMRAAGCTLNNAYMQHSLLALVVIPELRISDLGLVDVRTFDFIPVIDPVS